MKILWYKTLKKMKLLDQCNDLLIELNVIEKNDVENNFEENKINY